MQGSGAFWTAVVDGLLTLSNWRVYVALLPYLSLVAFPELFRSVVQGRSADYAEERAGLFASLLHIFSETIGIVLFVFVLGPMLLGLSDRIYVGHAVGVVSSNFVGTGVLLIVIVAVRFAIAFVPLVGSLRSVHTLITGAISLIYFMGNIKDSYPSIQWSRVHLMPDRLQELGFIGVCVAAAAAGALSGGAIIYAMYNQSRSLSMFTATATAALFGLLPIFVYASWIANQIQQ